MNCYNFSFKKSYTGFWSIDSKKTKIPGTLYLYDHSIELDLYCKGNQIPSKPISVKGEAFAKDENEKDVFYRFLVSGLHYKNGTHFSHGLNHYLFDIEFFFIYLDGYNLKKISSACLRTRHLDQWVSKINRNSYILNDEDTKNGHCNLEFVPHKPITLYHNNTSKYNINIYFGWQHQLTTNDIILKTKDFLNIEFGDQLLNIIDANQEVEKLKTLLYLLWNISFKPEFIEFRTANGNFIQKTSDKYAFQYIESSKSVSPHTQFDDYNIEEYNVIISLWHELYEKYTDAIETYFETICNSHLSPGMRIKNFVSTIDALTENFEGRTEKIPENSNKALFLNSLLDKAGDCFTKQDVKRLRDMVLKEKTSYLKPRFRALVDGLKDVLPDEIDDVFIEKIVNTRNNITHPKQTERNAFSPREYNEASYLLTKVIRAYLLDYLQIKKSIIKKIVTF